VFFLTQVFCSFCFIPLVVLRTFWLVSSDHCVAMSTVKFRRSINDINSQHEDEAHDYSDPVCGICKSGGDLVSELMDVCIHDIWTS
jgi:hypothetical protein